MAWQPVEPTGHADERLENRWLGGASGRRLLVTGARARMCGRGLERWWRHWFVLVRKPGPGAVSMSAAWTW
jgi:hypothetical protein